MNIHMAAINNDWLPYPWQLPMWEHLCDLKKSDRLPHALLVSGEKGSGKQNLVAGLSKKILCQVAGEFACGECKSCQLFTANTHPDLVYVSLVEKAKQIKVDQIRRVVDFISKTSQMNGTKIVVIEPAELMNISAANALLKCLEEPAGDCLIVLISHASHRLLPTIRSRCQSLSIPKPNLSAAESWLSTFINDVAQRQKLLSLSNGNPLQALAYWEAEVLTIYNGMTDKLLALSTGDISLIQWAQELQKTDVALWLDLNQKLLWQLIKSQQTDIPLEADNLQAFNTVVQQADFPQRAYKLLEVLQASIREVQGQSNPNMQLLLETLLMHWQAVLRQVRR